MNEYNNKKWKGRESMEESKKEIINPYIDEWGKYFADYFENQRVSRIRQKSEYQKLEKEICKIKNKYPNVVTLLEDGENIKLSNEEENAIIEILNLQEEINLIELKEACRVGGKKEDIEWIDRNEGKKFKSFI